MNEILHGLDFLYVYLDGVLIASVSEPFPVSKRSDKTVDVIINDKNVTVSIDRLKPAYVVAKEGNAALPKERTGNQNQQPIQPKA